MIMAGLGRKELSLPKSMRDLSIADRGRQLLRSSLGRIGETQLGLSMVSEAPAFIHYLVPIRRGSRLAPFDQGCPSLQPGEAVIIFTLAELFEIQARTER